jgi:hypothetical protein
LLAIAFTPLFQYRQPALQFYRFDRFAFWLEHTGNDCRFIRASSPADIASMTALKAVSTSSAFAIFGRSKVTRRLSPAFRRVFRWSSRDILHPVFIIVHDHLTPVFPDFDRSQSSSCRTGQSRRQIATAPVQSRGLQELSG